MRQRFPFLILPAACVLALASGSSALAQVDNPDARATDEQPVAGDGPNWGTTGDIMYNIGPDDFSVRSVGWANALLFNNSEILPAANGSLAISGPIHLPSGAMVKSITVFYTDTDTASDPSGNFWRSNTLGGLTNLQTLTFQPGYSGGNNNITVTLPSSGILIDNESSNYAVNFLLNRAATGVQGIYKARIVYRLVVSAAPAVATFTDVPTTDGRFRFVEALVASGLTGGCGAGLFCPDSAVTRGQMAVFLASALGLHWPN